MSQAKLAIVIAHTSTKLWYDSRTLNSALSSSLGELRVTLVARSNRLARPYMNSACWRAVDHNLSINQKASGERCQTKLAEHTFPEETESEKDLVGTATLLECDTTVRFDFVLTLDLYVSCICIIWVACEASACQYSQHTQEFKATILSHKRRNEDTTTQSYQLNHDYIHLFNASLAVHACIWNAVVRMAFVKVDVCLATLHVRHTWLAEPWSE